MLKFTSKDVDPTTGEPDAAGYEDEYPVEDLELMGSDYVTPAFAGSFDHAWETTGANGEEASETLQLSGTRSINGKQLTSLCHASILHGTMPLSYQMLTSTPSSQQTPQNNSPRPYLSNPLTARTSPLAPPLTPSNSTARHSQVGKSRRWSRWLIRPRAVSRLRSRCGVRRKGSPHYWWEAWLRFHARVVT